MISVRTVSSALPKFTTFVNHKNTMRIVILADPLDNQQAGIHSYTRNLISHLAKVDPDGKYFIIRRKKDSLFPHERQIIIKNYAVPGYAAFRMFFLIPRRIRKMKADIVVEPAHFGPFNLPASIKRVTVIHDLTPILFPKLHRFHSQLLQRIFLKGILRRASLIITNSANTSSDLKDYYPASAGKTVQIYLGRDPSMVFTPDQSAVKTHVGDRPYFLYTGTIEPRKNLYGLLEAFRQFKENMSSPHVLVITGGTGWRSKNFYHQLHHHPFRDEIILSGYVGREELASLYSHTEAFIFPSLYEGFGLPVLEAMSCGAACLVSNSSSLPEVGGEAALYFHPDNPTELTNLMVRIVEEEGLKESLSKKAVTQAAGFSWDKHVSQFHGEIKKLRI